MSDFKYAAINAALEKALSMDSGPLDVVWRGALSGEIPIVDATSAYLFGSTNRRKYLDTAGEFNKALASSTIKWPVSQFLMFVDMSDRFMSVYGIKGVECASVVAMSCLGMDFEFTHIQVMRRGNRVNACVMSDDTEDEKDFNAEVCITAMCMAGWMLSRNSESIYSTVPRAPRRRYQHLPSVRFRRVFITPTTKKAGAQRYEITGEHCPLHHVRGHLRYVSPDRPLFGRKGAHGAFWISEHWRGDEENGRIVQEYVPQPPRAA